MTSTNRQMTVNVTDQNKMRRLEAVVEALTRVNSSTHGIILQIVQKSSEDEIITNFNQIALDFFNQMIAFTQQMNKEQEYNFNIYLGFFEKALKANRSLPIDKFCLVILEFAPEIYAENDDCFMDMHIPDHKLVSENEFSMIRSEKFKQLWKILDHDKKDVCRSQTILLTTYAHAHFYKTVMKNVK